MFYLFNITRISPFHDELVVTDESGVEVFKSDTLSSYPDYPQGIGIKNDGMPDPTVKNGIYLLKETLQAFGVNKTNWRVLELTNLDGSQEVPVIRRSGESTSAGINLHFRGDDELHMDFVWSAGCLTLPMDEFKRLRDSVGMDKDSYKKGRIIGILVIQGEPTFENPYEGGKL